MASKKYKLGADGYYQTKVWDGTYNANGSKSSYHFIPYLENIYIISPCTPSESRSSSDV